MKKLIIFCVVVGLLSITNYVAANPTYIEKLDPLDILMDAWGLPSGGGPYSADPETYDHTYDGSVDPLVYTGVYGTVYGSATLTIVAEDVTGPGGGVNGEEDLVRISLDGGSNWTSLGFLQMLPDNSTLGETTTEFNLGDYIDLTLLEGGATTLTVEVAVEDYYWVKIKNSELVIVSAIPAPGAILLGSLGVGLVGWLRRRRTL